ncbi:hypothetical protein EES45_31865 [Streptomyces sp. ADI97-07]|nr:hypothetical protein EES45_31865 [Streptomyces sp. ADI97-07]
MHGPEELSRAAPCNVGRTGSGRRPPSFAAGYDVADAPGAGRKPVSWKKVR